MDLKNEINPAFYPLLSNENRFMVLRGGAGSGKSYFCAQKLLYRIMTDWEKPFKHRFLVLRKTLPYAKKSVFPLFRHYIHEWGLSNVCDINRTDCVITFRNGSEILISGLDDPEKVKSIFGITSIWMEEATELNLDDFRQLNLRMRGQIPTYYQMMLSFNPVSNLSWVYEEFYAKRTQQEAIQKRRKNTTLHFSTFRDNKFLDDVYKEELQALEDIDYMWYKVYTLGEWGSLENLIFKKWTYVDDFPTDIQEVVVGLDFGYTHPSAVVLLGLGKEGTYVKELIYKTKLTVLGLGERLKILIPEDVEYKKNVLCRETPIYCDNARPDAIQQLRSMGLNAIPASKGNNSVKDGIDTVKQQKLYITKDSTNIVKEIQQYKWKENREGQVFDEPVKLHDDAMDAMRYAAYMTLRKKKNLMVCFAEM